MSSSVAYHLSFFNQNLMSHSVLSNALLSQKRYNDLHVVVMKTCTIVKFIESSN